MTLINSRKAWMEEYKKDKYKIWVIVSFDDNEFFFKDYQDWFKIQAKIKEGNHVVSKVSLQYRSHILPIVIKDCDGVYIIRSIIGKVGGKSIDTMTVGLIKGDEVHKTSWSLPDLTEKDKNVDKIEDCFNEAVLLWK